MRGNIEHTGEASTISAADAPTIRYLSVIPGNDGNGTEMSIDEFSKNEGQ